MANLTRTGKYLRRCTCCSGVDAIDATPRLASLKAYPARRQTASRRQVPDNSRGVNGLPKVGRKWRGLAASGRDAGGGRPGGGRRSSRGKPRFIFAGHLEMGGPRRSVARSSSSGAFLARAPAVVAEVSIHNSCPRCSDSTYSTFPQAERLAAGPGPAQKNGPAGRGKPAGPGSAGWALTSSGAASGAARCRREPPNRWSRCRRQCLPCAARQGR